MGKYLQIARDFLDIDEWKYDYDEASQVIRCGVKAINASYRLLLVSREDKEQFMIYAIAPNEISEEKRKNACEFFTRANYGLLVGNFEMDMRDGEVRYKVSVDLEGGSLTHDMVSSMLRYAISTLDRYYPALMSMLFSNKSPKDAVEMIESQQTETDDDDDAADDHDDA